MRVLADTMKDAVARALTYKLADLYNYLADRSENGSSLRERQRQPDRERAL